MLYPILITVAVLIAGFLVFVATRPAEFRITRSATMAAPRDVVFAQVNDFRAWRAWSPWEDKDPALKRTYEGPAAGRGAVYSWAGNKEVGEGRMTITESRPSDFLRIKLEFLKPIAATNTAEFAFEPQPDGQTRVNWSMSGAKAFMMKAFCLFVDMDKLVGSDFEKGLASMKRLVESQPAAAVATAPAPAHASMN